MALDPRLPVIIGTAQVNQRVDDPLEALDSVGLIAEAITGAFADAGLRRQPDVDVLAVTDLVTWRHGDPGRMAADDLALAVGRTAMSTSGGNSGQTLVNEMARRIWRGEVDVAIVCGGEAMRTRRRAKARGIVLDWRKLPAGTVPDEIIGPDHPYNTPEEIRRGVVTPVQIYAMFETALRHHVGNSVAEHEMQMAHLWSRFSSVAEANPHAWSPHTIPAHELIDVSPRNRMISVPYPKLLTSNLDVDQGAAVVMCSVAEAERLGVARDRWVFVHSASDAHDTLAISNRRHLHDAPAVKMAADAVLTAADISIDDVGLIDLYGCFPAAVEICAHMLGLPLDRQLTVTGGLQFAGGPLNNYVTHSVATMVERLRAEPGDPALVWGNGGWLTKCSFAVYSTEPPASGEFRSVDPQAEIDALGERPFAMAADAAGPTIIEGYTVMFDRNGPDCAYAACLLDDGRRAWGTSRDAALTAAMCDGEWAGTTVTLDADGEMRV